jgi:galactose oxidase-like protein
MKVSFVVALILLGRARTPIAMAQTPGTFAATVEMTAIRAFHTATLLTNGKVLITGGTADNFSGPLSTASTIPIAGFIRAGDMTLPRSHHTATLLPDGRVLFAGGNITAGSSLIPANRAEIYDPSTGTFAATGNMIGDHACHEANLLGSCKVLIGGSYDNKGGVTNAELYDPATGTFALTGRYTRIADLNGCQGAASRSH